MRHTPPKELLKRNAEIIECCVCNPNIPTTFIADKFRVSIATISYVMDKYFSCVFGEIITFQSDIDSQKAIDQEIMYNKIYNGEPITV